MTEITNRDPESMDRAELVDEWNLTYELTEHTHLDDDERDRVWDRRQELWNEMRARTDVEMPECPECGADRWSQTVGGPKHCANCHLTLGYEHEELIEEINRAWQQIQARGSDDGE